MQYVCEYTLDADLVITRHLLILKQFKGSHINDYLAFKHNLGWYLQVYHQ